MFRVFFLNARLIFFFFFFWKTHANTFELLHIADSVIYIYQIHCISFCSTSFSNFSKRFNSRNSKSINALLQNCIPNNFAVKHLFFHSRPETFYAVCTIVFYRYWLSSRKGNLYRYDKKNKKLSFSKLSISLYSFFDDIHLKYTSSSQVELKLFPISSSSNFIVSFRLLKRVVLKQTRFY